MSAADLAKIENITIDEDLSLRRYQLSDAAAIQDLVETNRDHLAKFLPWAKDNDLAAEEKFVQEAVASFDAGLSFNYVIEKSGEVVGVIDFHNIQGSNAEIGYWLGAEYQHQGIMSQAVKSLIARLAPVMKLHRVVIKTDPSNKASQNVALKAGFTLEGIEHGAVLNNGEYKDYEVYYYLVEGV
ncbi:GNAT family protein [Xylocopilactobacillus apicola]|nr:GNAT family protein [Xylocopilactobacillus apicola]